ncbi:YutD family protein [Salicibibacter cibarius]|uniref:YutD family protein n=1 Tax=Salicibibacter cibarius TaxID=2743000 RepID=A0A7T6Z6Z2_9BACI|nr:YutD family protein [Salicibibacter cibarius]QQK77516.1 YutD family protein [Salicibibacter cibarius]
MVQTHHQRFELVEEAKAGWDEEAFLKRYSEILDKYDYIVGDWGHEQLRLRGFFHDNNKKASVDTKASTIYDYLYEYCNFDCPYFIVKKVT